MGTCLICGKKFKSLPTHIRLKHHISCKEYYDKFLKSPGEGKCKFCGKETSFKTLNTGYHEYCSKACLSRCPIAQKKREQTWLKKYGVDNPAKADEVKKKIKQRWLEKYGEHPMRTKEVVNRRKKTNLKKYGVEWPSQSREVQNKVKKTCLERYGVENVLESEEIKEKIKQTNLKKYGVENPNQNPDVRNRIKQTFLRKYGVTNPMKCEQIREKLKHTLLERYGVENITQVKEIREKVSRKFLSSFKPILGKYLRELELELVDEEYRGAHIKHRWRCLRCGYEFVRIWNEIQQGNLCPKCYPKPAVSKPQEDITCFLESLGLEVIRNDRTLIRPYELDIVIPSHKVAIEFDGLYWHSEEQVGKDYHLLKTNLCESIGYRLVHIFEDEWFLKKDIVKTHLKRILSVSQNLQSGRTNYCTIKQISEEEKDKFLEEFDIQGTDEFYTVSIGAFCKDKLIAVMTFRQTDKLVWQVSRFCVHPDFDVEESAHILLGYFKKNFDWQEICSYVDRRWDNGDLHQSLGFSLTSTISPTCWIIESFRRVKEEDSEYDLETDPTTRVWDCGKLEFTLQNKDLPLKLEQNNK